MTDMLKKIYESNAFYELPPSEEYTAFKEREREVWEQIETIIGRELSDRFTTSHALVSQQNDLDWFRHGFRLGASLMLELMN